MSVYKRKLTDLPTEVLDIIFDFVLVRSETIIIYIPWSFHEDCEKREPGSIRLINEVRPKAALMPPGEDMSPILCDETMLALLFVNKACHLSGQMVFYSRNTFRFAGFQSWWSLLFFLKCITPAISANLRRIEVFPWYERDGMTILNRLSKGQRRRRRAYRSYGPMDTCRDFIVQYTHLTFPLLPPEAGLVVRIDSDMVQGNRPRVGSYEDIPQTIRTIFAKRFPGSSENLSFIVGQYLDDVDHLSRWPPHNERERRQRLQLLYQMPLQHDNPAGDT